MLALSVQAWCNHSAVIMFFCTYCVVNSIPWGGGGNGMTPRPFWTSPILLSEHHGVGGWVTEWQTRVGLWQNVLLFYSPLLMEQHMGEGSEIHSIAPPPNSVAFQGRVLFRNASTLAKCLHRANLLAVGVLSGCTAHLFSNIISVRETNGTDIFVKNNVGAVEYLQLLCFRQIIDLKGSSAPRYTATSSA